MDRTRFLPSNIKKLFRPTTTIAIPMLLLTTPSRMLKKVGHSFLYSGTRTVPNPHSLSIRTISTLLSRPVQKRVSVSLIRMMISVWSRKSKKLRIWLWRSSVRNFHVICHGLSSSPLLKNQQTTRPFRTCTNCQTHKSTWSPLFHVTILQ